MVAARASSVYKRDLEIKLLRVDAQEKINCRRRKSCYLNPKSFVRSPSWLLQALPLKSLHAVFSLSLFLFLSLDKNSTEQAITERHILSRNQTGEHHRWTIRDT